MKYRDTRSPKAAVLLAALALGCAAAVAAPAGMLPLARHRAVSPASTAGGCCTAGPYRKDVASPQRPGRPIIPHRNLPDPFVLQVGHEYYLYSSQTSVFSPPASVTESKGDTLAHWAKTKPALTRVPYWATNGFTWSPDVRYIDGRYVMYFDAWSDKSIFYDASAQGNHKRAQCIGVATSKRPGGPFQPVEERPIVCQLADHGAIDPRTFLTPAGKLYLDWKSDDNAFVPERPTHIFAQRLSADGLHLVGKRSELLSKEEKTWTGALIEAPDMVYAARQYWLFFSGSWFNGPSYSIGVARCTSPTGPCHLTSSKPWLGHNAEGSTPGEESLFHNAGSWWMVYSPWDVLEHDYRPVELAKVKFAPTGPYLQRFSL